MTKRKTYMNVSIDYNLFIGIRDAIRNSNDLFRNRSHFVEMAIKEKLEKFDKEKAQL